MTFVDKAAGPHKAAGASSTRLRRRVMPRMINRRAQPRRECSGAFREGGSMTAFADLPMPLQLFLAFVFAVDLIGATAWAALITAWLGGKAIRAARRRAAQRLWREFQHARNATNGSQEAENNFSDALRHCASGLWAPEIREHERETAAAPLIRPTLSETFNISPLS